jgi:branched-chain amino acid transport system substrate-binding protein
MNMSRRVFNIAATALFASCVSVSAYAADEIKIGVDGPFTGGSASMGVSMRDGVRLATK